MNFRFANSSAERPANKSYACELEVVAESKSGADGYGPADEALSRRRASGRTSDAVGINYYNGEVELKDAPALASRRGTDARRRRMRAHVARTHAANFMFSNGRNRYVGRPSSCMHIMASSMSDLPSGSIPI